LSDVFNESGHRDLLGVLHALCEPDLGEGATDKIPRAEEAPAEHSASTPTDSHISRLEHVERQDRGIQQVPQFMREEPQALVAASVRAVEG
jgi:hypothetical protein